jgi:acyl dehydratase
MKFAQFRAGLIIDAGSVSVDETAVVEFAAQFDPQPFHVDRAAAVGGHWQGLIASGWHTCGLAMRLVVDHVLRDSESYASPGLEYVKWPSPVRPGDVLSLELEVLEARTSRSGEYGIVRWRWLMTNQMNAIVLDLTATSLFRQPQAA